MSTAAESAEWLRTAIDAEVYDGGWEADWVEHGPDAVRNVLDQNERLMSRGIEDLHHANESLTSELAKSNRLLAELYDIFIEGGYAEDGDGILLDNIDAIVGPPSERQQ